MSDNTSGSAAAGWYPDGSGRQRWWDGSAWTEHFAPLEAAPQQAAPQQAAPQQPSTPPAAQPYSTQSYGPQSYGTQPYGTQPYGTQSYATQPYATPYPAQFGAPLTVPGRTAGFVCGLIATILFWVWFASIPLGIVGWVQARKAMKAMPEGSPGRGLAVAGFVLGIIGASLGALILLVMGVRTALGAS